MVDVKSSFDDKERGFDVAHGARWTQSAAVHTEFVNNICRDEYTRCVCVYILFFALSLIIRSLVLFFKIPESGKNPE